MKLPDWDILKSNLPWGNWFIFVFNEQNVLEHICAYEKEPSESDIKELKEEIFSDQDFGLEGRTDLWFCKIDEEMYKELQSHSIDNQ